VSAGLRLRAAGAGDLGGLLALERACDGAPHWSEAAWLAMLTGDERAVIVAERQAELVGFVAVALVAGVASLESIGVDAAVRRQGTARMLCEAALAWARTQGATAMELEVRASNAAALGLYGGLGFVEQGRRPKYYNGPVEDAVLMGIDLT